MLFLIDKYFEIDLQDTFLFFGLAIYLKIKHYEKLLLNTKEII